PRQAHREKIKPAVSSIDHPSVPSQGTLGRGRSLKAKRCLCTILHARPPQQPPVVRPPLHPGQNFLFCTCDTTPKPPTLRYFAVVCLTYALYYRQDNNNNNTRHPNIDFDNSTYRTESVIIAHRYHRFPSGPPRLVDRGPHLVLPAAAAADAAIASSTLSGPSAAATIGQQQTVAYHRIPTAWISTCPSLTRRAC
ncbi:unnamed protein product, partial [Ectocarpus sp. 8 AP-2014]